MKRQYHAAFTTYEDYQILKENELFIVRPNNTVNTSNYYVAINHIVKPGKEVFILKNQKTGKNKRAKKIFIV